MSPGNDRPHPHRGAEHARSLATPLLLFAIGAFFIWLGLGADGDARWVVTGLGTTVAVLATAGVLAEVVPKVPWFQVKGSLEMAAPDALYPGEASKVQVRLRLQEGVRARGVRVELLGLETYYRRRGGRTAAGSLKLVKPFARTTARVAGPGSLPNAYDETWTAELTAPESAAPSVRGECVDVHWVARAVADVRGKVDLAVERPVFVHAAPSGAAEGNADREAESTSPECRLRLKLEQAQVRPGGLLEGVLEVEPQVAFEASAIRVELVRYEEAGDRLTPPWVKAQQDLTVSRSLSPSLQQTLGFRLRAPEDSLPTVQTPRSRLHWKVRGVVARRWWPDLAVERDVAVGPAG